MNAARLWVIGGLVALIGVIAIAWFAGIQPKLAEAANAEAERLATVEANLINEATLAALKEQYESLDELEAELAELQVAVPFRIGAPEFLAQVNTIAAGTGATVQEVTFGEARAYGSPTPAAAPVEPAEEVEGDADAEATEEAPAATSTAPLSPPAVTDPRITAGNFVAVPTSVTVGGPYTSVLAAIQSLQHGQRLFLVNGVALSPLDPAAVGPTAQYTGVVSGFIYVLIDPVAEEAAAQEAPAEEG